jgi:hypothetical protein
VRDYRGFVAGEGWRHGVAHGADLLMQLALNPALDKAQLDRILGRVARQVAPPGQAYVFGEPERLARPVLFAAARGLHTEAEWTAWLAQAAAAPPGRLGIGIQRCARTATTTRPARLPAWPVRARRAMPRSRGVPGDAARG